MDFAKKILNKFGWKEGDGLGKHNDGIAVPLKATLKFDNAGFGADQAASDFNNHWWERVFNEASQNVEIKQNKDGRVKIKRKSCTDELEISTKRYSLKKLKKAKAQKGTDNYDNFMSSSTLLTNGHEEEKSTKISVDDIAVTAFKPLTDEELFQACGGRTAHKGARHGLKLSGKLARVEQQEQELLQKMLASQNNSNKTEQKSVKKRKLEKSLESCADNADESTSLKKSKNKDLEEISTASCKKPKMKRNKEQATVVCEDTIVKAKKKKCKKKQRE